MHLAAQDNPAFSSLHCIWQMSSAERMLRISLFIMSDHLAWAGPAAAAQWTQLEQGGAQADCWARSYGLPLAWRSQWSGADQDQCVPWGEGGAQPDAQLEREGAQRALSQTFSGEPDRWERVMWGLKSLVPLGTFKGSCTPGESRGDPSKVSRLGQPECQV